MKMPSILAACFVLAAQAARPEDLLDRVSETLAISGFEDNFRAKLGGLIDLEGYFFQQPAPGLIYSEGHTLFNPRLSLFLDVQFGPHVYGFAQARLDRGFDPSDRSAEARLDEYALRITPWKDGRFTFQAGQFATVVGNWVPRHLSWDNPFVTAPLPYENPTAIIDHEAPESAQAFTEGLVGDKYDYSPVIWGPSYATGASISGQLGRFDYAAEVKNAALASRPESWDAMEAGFEDPTVSGRLGFRPNEMWNLGVSASRGPYFRPEAGPTLPPGRPYNDYQQLVIGQDVGFAWHHLQVWVEFYQARFQVPRVGNADTFAYYFEAKYKLTPQLFGALRWNQQVFSSVNDGEGGRETWGHDLWRADAALGYRFTAHTQLKLQYSLLREHSSARELGHLLAAQFTVKF